MKKQIFILIAFMSFCAPAYSQEKAVFLPKMDRTFDAILGYFKSPEEAEESVKKNAGSSDYFKAGYYFYNLSLSLWGDEKKNKDKISLYINKAADCLEKAVSNEPNNAYYTSIYGVIYTMWGLNQGFPKLIVTSSKGIGLMNKAVEMDPDNFEIRLFRLLQLSYFPAQYYPQYKNVIQNDEKIIIKWLADIDNAYSKNNDAKKILDKEWGYGTENSTKDEIYYCLGRYYYIELKDRKKGDEYFSKIDQKHYWYKRAEQNKKDVNDVSW